MVVHTVQCSGLTHVFHAVFSLYSLAYPNNKLKNPHPHIFFLNNNNKKVPLFMKGLVHFDKGRFLASYFQRSDQIRGNPSILAVFA